MAEESGTDNAAIKKSLDDFVESYELDMRGDKHLDNGNKGIIGEIRDIKEHLRDYPSLTFMFHKRPFKLIGAVLGIFFALYAVAEVTACGTGVLDKLINLFPGL